MNGFDRDSIADALGVLVFGGALVLLGGCGGSGAPTPVQADLALSATDDTFNANRLRRLYQKLSSMAEPMRNRSARESPPLRGADSGDDYCAVA